MYTRTRDHYESDVTPYIWTRIEKKILRAIEQNNIHKSLERFYICLQNCALWLYINLLLNNRRTVYTVQCTLYTTHMLWRVALDHEHCPSIHSAIFIRNDWSHTIFKFYTLLCNRIRAISCAHVYSHHQSPPFVHIFFPQYVSIKRYILINDHF